MTAPAINTARGIVRRASWISSPIVDALSTPPKANAMVDQKITSFRPVLGTNVSAVMGVADPKRLHVRVPRVSSAKAGMQLASAPMLFSHLPTLRPTTFSVTARVSPDIATVMKYPLFDDNPCHAGPPMNSALAAAKE